MKDYSHFDPDTVAPQIPLPAGACDSQIHVFGDPEAYPYSPRAAYLAPDATIEAALKMHSVLGIEKGIVVQSTAYGTDHRALLDALAVAGPGYRGCGVVDDDTTDEELARLHEGGVRGARFNFHGTLGHAPSADLVRRTIARVAELGWYVKFHVNGLPLAELDVLDDVTGPAVIDHFGPLDYSQGLQDANFGRVRELLGRGNWYVMVSNGDRRSQLGSPYDDAAAYARGYIATAPERVLWGTDWPHPLHTGVVPNDGHLVDLLHRYAPDEAELRRVLLDNPAELFGV
ncbi:2-pyrone-4,6-dicarboxylate hydrolase [Marmoricola endophyticus]|uniref:2-pyrone-4,6-dicarboxylate hydrolase n=1 Tax=Marmoricola endophyticus TaxID=2040280 RepID=A0A917BNS7_9ACTN|nr:amidohydrolase family protein [Marmoricola endophyticus]GGF51163.1 2-pyrone-4,6-dicarboxylate hydrolase [Marmoricola endophyticus]